MYWFALLVEPTMVVVVVHKGLRLGLVFGKFVQLVETLTLTCPSDIEADQVGNRQCAGNIPFSQFKERKKEIFLIQDRQT